VTSLPADDLLGSRARAEIPRPRADGPRHVPRATLGRLVSLVASEWVRVLGTALLALATVGSGIGLIAMAAYLISRSAEVDSTATLTLTIVGVRFFAVTRAVSRYLERYVGHLATFRVLTRVRSWFFRGIAPLAPAGLQNRRRGDLLARILGDIDTLQDVTLRVAVPALAAVFAVALTAGLLGSFAVVLGIAVAGYLIVVGVVLPALVRRVGRDASEAVAAARADLEGDVAESLAGLSELVGWGRTDRLVGEVDRRTEVLCGIDRRLARLRGVASGLGALLVGLAATTVLALAVPMVTTGELQPVYLALMPLVTLAAFEAVLPLAASMEHLGRARSAAARLDELVDADPELRDPVAPAPAPRPVRPGSGIDLDVEHLSFSYDQGVPPVLQDVSFRVPSGACAAVIGPSGCGKSTLVALLLRFWDYQTGSLRLGGTELSDLRADDARRLVATVQQHDHLFDTTVRDNLLLADPDADDVHLLAALDAADARGFIAALDGGLSDGLGSRIGENGTRLSGGERQRLMIARALLAEAPVLVLDEATAHLDAPTEERVLAGVRRWHGDRTLILISHRAAVAAGADMVIDLAESALSARTPHSERGAPRSSRESRPR